MSNENTEKLNEVLKDFYKDCLDRGYYVLPSDNETTIFNRNETVTLELTYNSENKLSIDFYKDKDATDFFVNELMAIFTTTLSREPAVVN